MKKLLIHIGYPKTATSTLQLNLFSKLCKEGQIEYLNHLVKSNPNFGNIKCTKIIAYVLGQTDSTEFQDEIDGIKSITNTTTVISNENISFFEENFSWAYLGHNGYLNLNRVKEVFDPYFDHIEILIGIRNQSNLIPSFYAEAYNMIVQEEKKFKRFDTWLETNFKSSVPTSQLPFNFYQMAQHASSLFGKENIHFLFFEELKSSPDSFYKKLASVLDHNVEYIKSSLSTNFKNVTVKNTDGSLTANKKTLNMIITDPFRKVLKRFDKNTFMKIREVYHLLIPGFIRNYKTNTAQKITAVSEEKIKYLNDLYEASNLCLQKEFDLPEKLMKESGYFN